MKRLNGRTLPRVSEACNFGFIFHSDPSLCQPFDALPEIVGIDLTAQDGSQQIRAVRAERLYNSGPAGYFSSGVPFKQGKAGISQFAAAELLLANSPLVVPTEHSQAIVCATLARFDFSGYTVITAVTLAELIGVEIEEPFTSSRQMRNFFHEVAISYF